MLGFLASAPISHFPLATGASFGARFSTLETALHVEDITRSQSTSRIAFCDTPYFWFKFTPPQGFTRIMVGGTVPVIERFEKTRVAVALIGPGLPTASLATLPPDVVSQVPAGMGALTVPGRPEQSRCDWMEDPLSRSAYSSRPGTAARVAAYTSWPTNRCHYFESWGKKDMWVVQDKLLDLQRSGTTHYLVYWAPGDQLLGPASSPAKFGVVMGNEGQREAFHGGQADAGSCSQDGDQFYELSGNPAVPVPYSCNSSFAGVAECGEASMCGGTTPCGAAVQSTAQSSSQAATPSVAPSQPAGCTGGPMRLRRLGHPSDTSNCATSSFSIGVVVGAVLGGCVLILALVVCVWRSRHRRTRQVQKKVVAPAASGMQVESTKEEPRQQE